ncbi:MAG: hypothetical protein PHF72_00540 [Gammaproteobacteria bacterium]|nr:hypothetical protein [Gammaproteobacteria bacterium]
MTNAHPEERSCCLTHDRDGYRETVSGEVRVAILGGGEMARELADLLRAVPGVRITGLWSERPSGPLRCWAAARGLTVHEKLGALADKTQSDLILDTGAGEAIAARAQALGTESSPILPASHARFLATLLADIALRMQVSANRYCADYASRHCFGHLGQSLLRRLADLAGEGSAFLPILPLVDPDAGLYHRDILVHYLDQRLAALRRYGEPVMLLLAGVAGTEPDPARSGETAEASPPENLRSVSRHLFRQIQGLSENVELLAYLGGGRIAAVLGRLSGDEAVLLAESFLIDAKDDAADPGRRDDDDSRAPCVALAVLESPGCIPPDIDAQVLLDRIEEELAASLMNHDDLVVFAPGSDSPRPCPNTRTETTRS